MTQPSSTRITTYRRMLAAFNANDLSVVEQFVSQDLRYVIPGRSAIAGTTVDIAGHLKTLGLARDLTHGTLRLTSLSHAEDGEYLFIWGRLTATRGAKQLDTEHAVMYRFEADRVVEGRTLPVDLYAFDDFWC